MITHALSLRQPWAWLVLNGKTIENRRWPTRFRGDFFLHSAKGMTRDEYEDAVDFAREVAPKLVVPAFDALDRGGIVGRARLVNVISPCTDEQSLFFKPCSHPWHIPAQHGFVLADVRPLPFTPMAGSLSFFRVPVDIAQRLAA